MVRHYGFIAIVLGTLLSAAAPAAAQDAFAAPEPQYLLNLGAGVATKPLYPGADKYMIVPYPIIEAGRFFIPGIGQTETKLRGIYVYPSFSLNGERKGSDDNSLKGTKDVDWAFEAGLGGGFRYDWVRAFATIRQGFNGYSGQTGELGMDVILPIGNRFEMAFGPRTSWGSDGYMEAYFGVTPKEASNSKMLSAYDPGAGFKTAGLAAQVNYWIDDNTRFQVKGSWDYMIGEAGDSPIVEYGSRNQWMVGVGISRKLSFDVFR